MGNVGGAEVGVDWGSGLQGQVKDQWVKGQHQGQG